MKIIHLSDTHVGYGDNETRLRRIVDDLTKTRSCDPNQHLVVHTGDLLHEADNKAARDAAHALLEELSTFGYGVLLCPGNHDYGDSMSMSRQHAEDFRAAFNDFIHLETDNHALDAHLMPNGTGELFPVVHIVAGDYALIGVDSCWAEMTRIERFFAEGRVGVEQLLALNMLLDRPELADKKIVVYLHHHPYYYGYTVKPDLAEGQAWSHWLSRLTRIFRRLKDAHSFNQMMRDRVDVLLFGHMHFGLDCRSESQKYGIPLAFDGSSSTCMTMDTDRMRYRIIDLDTMTATTRFIML